MPPAEWKGQNEFRNSAELFAFWRQAPSSQQNLFAHETKGRWWELLHELKIRLYVTREYEHSIFALATDDSGRPDISAMCLPHPSGIAIDVKRKSIYVASTRNPNVLYELKTVTGNLPRTDILTKPGARKTLIPYRTKFLPGALYLHDLAMVNGELFANSVGQNAVVRLPTPADDQDVTVAWWPKCVENEKHEPELGLNFIQLNSIGAGASLEDSYFSASCDNLGKYRPGDLKFPVDKQGVIFSGKSRVPIVRGLTRPHSVRLHEGHVWVNNSGYGELCRVEGDSYRVVCRLPGWTRGLCFVNDIAFVGTSRIIAQYKCYAPGLEERDSICGLHAVNIKTGEVLGSLHWPGGNQIFGIEQAPRDLFGGFPFSEDMSENASQAQKDLFYSFLIEN
jgi:uncharacterized protein (TIGR03032 family)